MKKITAAKKTNKRINEGKEATGDINIVNSYLKDIRHADKEDLLSKEEEYELLRRWIKDHDQSAKDRLMIKNQKLVFSRANAKCHDKSQLGDFISIGNIGLSDGIDHYNLEKGTRLSTIATLWIDKRLIEYLYGDNVSGVRRPHEYQIGSNINKCKEKFFQENGRDPNREELKQMLIDTRNLHIPDDELDDVINTSMNTTVSHDDGDSDEMGDIGEIATRSASYNEVEREIENEYMAKKVAQLFRAVDDRTAKILKMKFGIAPYDIEYEDQEIAEELGVTKTRVQQLYRAALVKLRDL